MPDDIGPRRQELAELDVGRPKPRQRSGEALRAVARAFALDQPREPQRRRVPAAASQPGSTSANAPSRASTKPARRQPGKMKQGVQHDAGAHSFQPE